MKPEKPKNKKALTIILIILGIIAILLLMFISKRNTLVKKSQAVDSAWSNVLTDYQRRYDLIPNLVATVQAYAEHETETFTQVTQARANATSFTVTKDVLDDPVAFQKFQTLQGDIEASLSRLLAVAENYPDLKANETFLTFQSQLEGTENRIAVDRKNFNEAVQDYNTYLQMFPNNIIASISNFKEKTYFNLQNPEAEVAPKVNFDK
ncbi:LemA family protein [Patescibacteria group bacterium]|nr:LemA family protein [Patescibacteria group bacterium]